MAVNFSLRHGPWQGSPAADIQNFTPICESVLPGGQGLPSCTAAIFLGWAIVCFKHAKLFFIGRQPVILAFFQQAVAPYGPYMTPGKKKLVFLLFYCDIKVLLALWIMGMN